MIYVIELEDGHYFLMRNDNQHIKDTQLLFEAEIRYEYPKLHLPVCIHSKYSENLQVDLDKYVKQYMLEYGIDKVRGGSYSLPVLPEYKQLALLDEMKTAQDQSKLDNTLDYALNEVIEYANQPHTKEEIRLKQQKIKFNYEKYLKEQSLRIVFDVESVRKDLIWLYSECENQLLHKEQTYIYALEKMQSVIRYRNLLVKLSQIRTIITGVLEKSIENIEIKHPEFVLDDFIYHQHRMHLPISIVKANQVYNEYVHYLNIIENRKAECDFDIASWGKHADIVMPNMIYLLDKLRRFSTYS